MHLQEITLKRFKEIYPHYSLRRISRELGIDKSRLSRLFHGRPMRLDEYQLFKTAIESELDPNDSEDLLNIVKDAEKHLSLKAINGIKKMIKRKVHIKKLTDCDNDPSNQYLLTA